MNKFIALDTETGGLDTNVVSLLTVALVLLDENLNVTEILDLRTKPKDGIYKVTGQALDVNKIDLTKHDKEAMTYEEAATKIYDFLNKATDNGKVKLIPLGHNIYYDLQLIFKNLLTRNTWEKFVSYRLQDTGVLGQFLKEIGVIPQETGSSLGSLVNHYQIVTGTLHNALEDTMAVVELYKRMISETRSHLNNP